MKKPNIFLGKTVWIIGASEGIGRALAIALDNLGASLILSARSEIRLIDLQHELKQKSIVLPMDVAQITAMTHLTQNLLRHQPIDHIFFFPAYYEPSHIRKLNPAVIDKTIDINFRAAVYFLSTILPYLEQQPTTQLFFTSSLAGYIGLPASQPYAATKAAMINLIESAKAENPHLRIRLINPGFVKTRLTDKNRFTMPGLLSPQQAAQAIIEGACDDRFDIYFPKKLALALRFLRTIPYRWYFYIAKRYLQQDHAS